VVIEPGNWSQPPVETMAWLNMLWETLGVFGIMVVIVGMMGLRGVHLAQWIALTFVLGVSLLMGAAAGHQRAYLCLFGPSLALGIGHLLPGLGWPGKDKVSAVSWGFILVLLLGVRPVVAQSANDIREISRDLQRTRAVDLAIERSVPGDGIWLVTPALQPDDDKQAISSLLWRFKPWNRMAMAQPVAFAFEDWSYGQPRQWEERVVHTSTELDPAAFDHVMRVMEAEGKRMFVALADHGPAAGLEMRVHRVLRPYRFSVERVGEDRGMGTDRLFVVTGKLPQ